MTRRNFSFVFFFFLFFFLSFLAQIYPKRRFIVIMAENVAPSIFDWKRPHHSQWQWIPLPAIQYAHCTYWLIIWSESQDVRADDGRLADHFTIGHGVQTDTLSSIEMRKKTNAHDFGRIAKNVRFSIVIWFKQWLAISFYPPNLANDQTESFIITVLCSKRNCFVRVMIMTGD